MKPKVFFGIALYIIALFTFAMLGTYVPVWINWLDPEFFNDTKSGPGTRHIWYDAMMCFLFVLSLINVIVSIIGIIKKHYDTKKWGP